MRVLKHKSVWPRLAAALTAVIAVSLTASLPSVAKNTGQIFVSNEKDSTITVLDASDTVVNTIKTCARPRGMHFNQDRTQFFVGCADDSTIAVYDIATLKLIKRFHDIEQPETFDLHPDGKRLFISNEEDAMATAMDVTTGEEVAMFETGEEPEGVQITPDGRLVFVASEAANLVHVIDIEKGEVIKDIIVGTRPRRFALTPDGKELWVSAELSGVIDIINLASLTVTGNITFEPTGMRREYVTPVDVLITKDGARAYVALGHAAHVAVVDVESRNVIDYVLVGRRPWGLALNRDESKLYVTNGLSDDLSIIDTASLKVRKSVPVGRVPYGILIDDE